MIVWGRAIESVILTLWGFRTSLQRLWRNFSLSKIDSKHLTICLNIYVPEVLQGRLSLPSLVWFYVQAKYVSKFTILIRKLNACDAFCSHWQHILGSLSCTLAFQMKRLNNWVLSISNSKATNQSPVSRSRRRVTVRVQNWVFFGVIHKPCFA